MLVRLLLLLLALWVAVSVLGFLIKGLFWLAVVGVVFFLITSALGWSRRDQIKR